MILYDKLKDMYIVFVATLAYKWFPLPVNEPSNKPLLEIFLHSFCRGTINKVFFTLPLEWSGKSFIFSPQKMVVKKKFLFALSHLVYHNWVDQ